MLVKVLLVWFMSNARQLEYKLYFFKIYKRLM